MAFRPSTQYECPFCKGIIPSADVNASTDLALCRACGKTSSFSVISCQSELATVDLDHPPPRVRVGLTSDGRSKVVYRARSFVLLGFVLLWFAIVIGLVCGIQLYYSHFEPSITVIGAPGALALFLLGIYFAFARWEITAALWRGDCLPRGWFDWPPVSISLFEELARNPGGLVGRPERRGGGRHG
jgi:hypothetical protein